MENVADVHTRQSVMNEKVWLNRKINEVLLLHDNVRPHTILHTSDTIAAVVWTAVLHPPSCSIFHLIGHLKNRPRRRRGHFFADDDELKHSVREDLQRFSEEF
jgi:hypothetical protein